MACAIGGKNKTIIKYKREILKENTLDAVFSLPAEIFYPGASASACCMVFKTGKKHDDVSNPPTFFGYYRDDGFKKKKGIGRVEQVNTKTKRSYWDEIEEKWIHCYATRKDEVGLSVTKYVTADEEWLSEAYMTTDYSKLTYKDFESSVKNYILFKASLEE